MAKPITIAGERLTEADQRALVTVHQRGTCYPWPAHLATYRRLVKRGLLVEVDDRAFSFTLHGKAVGAALVAYKEALADD